jgi:hypothetical protein
MHIKTKNNGFLHAVIHARALHAPVFLYAHQDVRQGAAKTREPINANVFLKNDRQHTRIPDRVNKAYHV